jgi:hypothetical protein
MAPESVAFGVRLDADTVARLDALAAAHSHKRGWALARAVCAGLDALDGSETTNVPRAPTGDSRTLLGPNEIAALADALGERLAPALATAVARAESRAGAVDVAPVGVVGVARVVDALRAAVEFAASQPEGVARARLAVAATDAILALTAGDVADLRDGPNGLALRQAVRRVVACASQPDSPSAGPVARGAAAPRAPQTGARRRRRASDPAEPLAPALKAARTARGLTQDAAATDAGVSVVSYRRAEQGRQVGKPTRTVLDAWAKAHGPA